MSDGEATSDYLPLSLDEHDGQQPENLRRGEYYYLPAGVWIKAAAMLCVLLLVLKDPPMEKEDFGADLQITITGPPRNIWSSIDTLHRCHLVDVPDIPTRAFRDSSTDQIHMIQGSTSFYRMNGPSLLDVHRDCHASWNKTANGDPSMFAANEFLDSPIVWDNGTVIALAHTEYPGDNYHNCTGPHYPHCWIVSLGLMISHDFGATWRHARPPPHHLVASVPYQYDPTQLACGWGDPTNILKHPSDGHYYFAAWNRNAVGLQPPGVCMMRSHRPLDPSSWRAWNGLDYDVQLVSPYGLDPTFDPAHHICTVLDVDPTILDPTQCNPFGLVYSAPLQLFLMTWACLSGRGAIHLTTSEDLIHWSTPVPIYDATKLDDATRRNVTSLHYPNLMDPTAPTRFGDDNYGTVGEDPFLFWVSFGHNVYSDGRSAWATPLHIQRNQQGGTMVKKG